jgi:hypothetical protein
MRISLLTLLMLIVSAIGSAASADEIKIETVAKPNEARQRARDRQRRVIFNNDGGEPVVEMKSPTVQDFLDCRTTKLAGTQVDSIFYCSRTSGFGVFTHFTKIGQVFTCTEGRYAGNQMSALLRAGLDPLQMQIDFCRKQNIEIFWSLRMNDTHDGSKADYGPILFRDNRLKNKHPEYLLGTIQKPLKHGAWSAVNFALPEVRELAFRYIEEVCRNYDIDGIELDFFRHPVFFKSTSRGEPATQAELDAMTELVQRVRAMTEEVGTKRGKPILIAMKVPDSAEYCRTIGLDLETWLKQDCLDLLIPGGYFQINDWEASIALARKYGVKVYPSLDESRLKDKDANALRVAITGYRGRASSAWAAGADGIYFFNFNDTQPGVSLLNEAGDPRELAKRDRDYFASPRGVGNAAGGNFPFEKFMTIETLNPGNPKTLVPNTAVVARLHTGEPANRETPTNYTLRLQLNPLPEAKFVRAIWNGKPIELAAATGWLESQVAAKTMKRGENRLELTLTGESPKKKVQWTDLMLQVRPRE